MEEKIKEVQDYFKSKILAGEFTFVKSCDYTITIRVKTSDNQSRFFCFWMANGLEHFRKHNSSIPKESTFIDLDFSKTENESAYVVINEIWQLELKKAFENKKAKEIKELEERLKTLKSKP